MYKIDCKITIAGKTLSLLDSVEIKSDINSLMDTAVIKLPSTVFNKYLKDVESIVRGQEVEIWLGYDGELNHEFSGYIRSVERDFSGLVINVENELYLFSIVKMDDKVYDNPCVKDLLKAVLNAVETPLKLDCRYDFSFDKFTVNNAMALDVLKAIQSECKCSMYIKDGVFYVVSPFLVVDSAKTVKYDTAKNIMAEGYSLKYKDKADRKFKAIAQGKDKTGEELKAEKGETGGDTETFEYKGIATQKMLDTIVEQMYERRSFSGYDGSFQGWFLPKISKGDSAEIYDQDDPERNGRYFVNAVETSCSSGGITRKITLGKRL